MAVAPDTPVSAIEGIGPAAERLLQAQGLFTVYDMLRASAVAVHEVVAALASIDEVRSWRQMAVLLQVAAVTPQWAEALVKANAGTFADLRRLDLSELQAIFDKARTDSLIQDVPSSDQAAVMLKDAALLDFSGALTGTVTDRDGRPVAGAAVSASGEDAVTDGRGRFRLLRLPLDTAVTLRITADGRQPLAPTLVPRRASTVLVQQFQMSPAVAAGASQTAGAGLDELNGDVLPAMTGQPLSSHEVALDTLKRSDLLKLTFEYAAART